MSGTLTAILVLTFGAVVGSFLNVVILRTHAGQSWLSGRSQCPHCHHPLAWWELIPILSFVFLRGRCHVCRATIHWQYPVVELLTALAFFGTWSVFGWSPLMLAAFFVAATMILIAVYDARWAVIPDEFTGLFALGAAVAVGLADRPWWEHLLGAVAGSAFFGLQYLVSRGQWVGSGDILLGGAIGLLLGWRFLGLGLFAAYMIGSLVASMLIAGRRLSLRHHMPFGPYLLLGTCLAWLWGQGIVDWYFRHAIFT